MSEQAEQQSMLLAEDSPVSRLAEQDTKRGKMMSGSCGMKCCELSMTSDQTGCSVKMWPDCFQLTKEEPLMKSSKTWKVSVTQSSRLFLQRMPVERHLMGKGFSSLPRPRVADTEGAPVRNCENFNGSWSRRNKQGVRYGVKLKDVLFALYRLRKPSPTIYEATMGFPIGWTDLNA